MLISLFATRRIFIGLIFLIIIQTIVSFPSISYVTTSKNGAAGENQGSTEGYTLLWIRGDGFAQDGFSQLPTVARRYVVKLVKDYSIYDCQIVPEEVTDSRLPCYTSAMSTGSYEVRIYENGYLVPKDPNTYDDPRRAKFESSIANTPIIQSVTPISGLPQRLVSLTGDFKTNCYTRDVKACASDSVPLISRVYVGDQLCDLMDATGNAPYSTVNRTHLQCLFKSNDVGVFNISVIVTDQYGRSSTDLNQYRLSATGQLYNFQSYALISNISPNTGSMQGGTILTITGQYFSESSQYPLAVNVGDQPCTILSANSTTIRCQSSFMSSNNNPMHYHGGRGFHAFHERVLTNISNLRNSSIPMPSSNATMTWLEEASFVSQNASNSTVWLIGYLRPPMNTTLIFQLDTNVDSILFLSNDENPDHVMKIANRSSPESSPIALQHNKNYYIVCISSTRNAALRLAIKMKMQEAVLTTIGNTGAVEKQQIDIGGTVVVERQRIVYSTMSTVRGEGEVQNIAVINELFQIGFRGVYTSFLIEAPEPEKVQKVLNDLPTIYPFEVTVIVNRTSYQITFPVEMGDVPPLMIISSKYTSPQEATEIVKGVASGTHLAFELNGATTNYLEFWTSTITNQILQDEFNRLFSIRCPPSLNNREATPSIVYMDDFESTTSYDTTIPIADRVFCGRSGLPMSHPAVLVSGNARLAKFMCFAYKLPVGISITLKFKLMTDDDPTTETTESIVMTLTADAQWHYKCIDLELTLVQQNIFYSGVESFLIMDVTLDSFPDGVMFDTVSLRTALPDRYEDEYTISLLDRSSTSPCTFPFLYNDQYYNKCTLDENNAPICRSASNQTFFCQSSSIEGVRRLFPKYQLLNNLLSITHTTSNRTINLSFQYTDCKSPTLIKPLPPTHATVTRISAASKPIDGVYDIMFKGQTYSAIPAKIAASNLVDLLQSFPAFDYVKVIREGECARYIYKIEWVSKGDQPLISIVNSMSVTPANTSISVSTSQQGNDGNKFYGLPTDMMRTYHRQPQVEVIVRGYSSYCSNLNNDCQFQLLVGQTPTIISVVQNGLNLIIVGSGFSSLPQSNTVSIGDDGTCQVTEANTTTLLCTITNSSLGTQVVRVNVDGKGYASTIGILTVIVPLVITSFEPITGAGGGGYSLTVYGSGFSSKTIVTLDGSPCINFNAVNFSTLVCTVPPARTQNSSRVILSVVDGINAVTASSLFVYNTTNTPIISSIEPRVVTVSGGVLDIIGTGFGAGPISVSVGPNSTSVLSSSSNYIQVLLPKLSPGLYPILIQTPIGFARPLVYIEYRFYVQAVSPQISSLYGNTDIYIHGEGFNNDTSVGLRDQTNRFFACPIIAFTSNQIQCRTVSVAKQITITSSGIHPIYGSGFAWSSRRQTVEQGTIVTWNWNSSELVNDRYYRIQQVTGAYSTDPVINGFDSGPASVNGTFSYQFNTLGTFYYWSTVTYLLESVSMRGIIDVIPSQSQLLTVEVTSNNFSAQTCFFPFTFNSINYTQCILNDDTRLWCSPTPIYTGQRLYCTPNIQPLNSSCSSNTTNTNPCNQTIPSSIMATQLLATLCTTPFITSLSPIQGKAGTLLTITGRGFDGQLCEYDVQIGSSYHCPLINITPTQLTCRIENGSMLDATTTHIVRVTHLGQGYLGSEDELKFIFLTSIFNVSPTIGSIDGGTQVVIEGDGFLANNTQVYIADTNYTSLITVNNSRIIFTTLQESTYPDLNLTVLVRVGLYQSVCLGSCIFCWATAVTPILSSVMPSIIRGPTNLILTGENLLGGGGGRTYTNVHVTINGRVCNVTGMNNDTVNCSIAGAEVGDHQIVGWIDGVGTIRTSVVVVTSEPVLLNTFPAISGIYGGSLLIINGYGFSLNMNNSDVFIGMNPCPIIQSAATQIKCLIPARGNSSDVAAIQVNSNTIPFPSSFSLSYSATLTPHVISVSTTSSNPSIRLQINGYNFGNTNPTVYVGNWPCSINSFSSTSIQCTISSSLGAGRHPVVVYVDAIGNSNSDVFYIHNLLVSSILPTRGSYGGGLSVTIFGQGFNATNIIASVCNQLCASVIVVSNTQLICVTPNVSMSEVNRSCNLTVTVDNISANSLFTYESNLTATVTSISPNQGGTGGGTLLTIQGINFPNATDAVIVRVGDVICALRTINSTTITCRTGRYSQKIVEVPVTVLVNKSGLAISSAKFRYMNLWSSRWTWGGDVPPEAGTQVEINDDTTVFLDVTTPQLKVLIIDNATLIFDDSQDVELNVEYIVIINGGVLQIGTESNPFQHRAVITLYGHLRSIQLPIFGAKVIALRNGTLDVHGKSTVRTWTQLGATAYNGTSIISLLKPVNWSINSEIIIATTGDRFSQSESEVRRITNISSDGLTLTLDKPLTYTHLGVIQQVNTTSIEVRGEVGLLSHNVVIQGSITEGWNDTIVECRPVYSSNENSAETCSSSLYGEDINPQEFGATIMASQYMNDTNNIQSVVIRLSNVELYNVGQAFRLNRFPLNFYMNGNMSLSYIKSCSIHYSFNRAINIQASNDITIENNVIYNIMGNGVLLSNGVETGNVFRSNLVITVIGTSSLVDVDYSPAAFWLTNPNNIVENNAVVGCSHYGYWYQLQNQPAGLSADLVPNYCPYKQPLGGFSNNSVHSTGRYGVWIYPQYVPTVSGGCNDPNPSVAVFEGLISWKNTKGIEWVMAKTIQIKNALIFDNIDTSISCYDLLEQGDLNPIYLRPTFYNPTNGSSVIDSIIIGNTNMTDTLMSMPSIAGLIGVLTRGFLVKNVTFINFLSNQVPAIIGPLGSHSYDYRWGGWLTKFSNMSFINVALRGRFQWSYESMYEDTDGTLTSQNQSMIILPVDGLTNASSSCISSISFENAVQCSLSDGPWVRLWFQGYHRWYNPPYTFTSTPLIISNEYNHSTSVPWFSNNEFWETSYVVTLQVNHTYQLTTSNIQDWYDKSYSVFVYDLSPGDFLIFQHHMEPRLYGDFGNKSTALLSGSSNPHGEWFYDDNTRLFSYIIKNPVTVDSEQDIKFDFIVRTCPECTDCECPTTTTQTTTTATTETTTSETTVSTTTQKPLTPITDPGYLLPTDQHCINMIVRYWSNDAHWTDPQDYANWYGIKPPNNQNIFIARCTQMIIDCPLPPIRSLRIDGILEFQQGRNHIMYVDSISINGGKLIAGQPDNPFNGSVDIILTANAPINTSLPENFPRMEQRMIGVLGTLDLHGLSRNITWTRLGRTASSGSYLIHLRAPVDWKIGDEIIITTTDQSISHTERHRIANIINSTLLRIEMPLAYTHLVIWHQFPNRQVIDIAAAVGLLSHNVRVIGQVQAPNLSGLKILITDYRTQVFYPDRNQYYNTYYKGYARLSNVQFIGFGQFDDTPSSDAQAGIYMNRLLDWYSLRPTYIEGCSFVDGFNGAIGMKYTNGIPIRNNVIYKTYRTGISITGRENIVENNLVSTIYWTGTAQSSNDARVSTNYDGAIMSRERSSYRVIMRDNLVAGTERIAYRIRGNPCSLDSLPTSFVNEFSNNEAHSVMSGVTLWPTDRVSPYDRECVLIQGFKVYKAWYYGFYLNTPRNITIDSCSSIDSQVGIFTFVIGPSPLTRLIVPGRTIIQNSLIVGSISPNDCNDQVDINSANILNSNLAAPTVTSRTTNTYNSNRTGIIFPTVSTRNNAPGSPWTGLNNYPCLEGSMLITDTTLAFFNNVCNRNDTAIQASQTNDDGQFPITTRSIYRYNISESNLIFNGQPNVEKVITGICVDMACDGLKTILLTDTDGTLFNNPSSVFSQADVLWKVPSQGVSDSKIPREFRLDLNGRPINISSIYPYRGITRSSWCYPESRWGMHRCEYQTDYRMLFIESMDIDTENRRISPISIASDNGYIDLINGPQSHADYEGYINPPRISNFMAIIQSNRTYQIYFTASPPKHLRFRLIDGNPSIKCVLAIYYPSLQQIDVYANTTYVSPTNRDMRYNIMILKDENNTVSLSSTAGSNYFDRKYSLLYFAIDGSTTIELKESPLFVLSFGLPPMDADAVYADNVASKLAALFRLDRSKIRKVKIVPETEFSGTSRRGRRQISPCRMIIEMRDEPRSTSTGSDGIRGEVLSNVASTIINSYQAGQLADDWKNANVTNELSPTWMTIKEPFNDTTVNLSIINRTELRKAPADCREQSPCTIQPVLVAYDVNGTLIQKLGTQDQPWQVQATVVYPSNVTVSGSIANYSDGQTQYNLFSLPSVGSYEIQFTFLQPDGVRSTFFQTTNLTVEAASVSVSNAILDGQQVGFIDVIDVNQTFEISTMPIDKITRLPLAEIQWGNWTWRANVTLRNLPKYNCLGVLNRLSSSRTTINLQTGIITITGLSISAPGMFILNIQLISTNGEHVINMTSHGILVKNIDDDSFISEMNAMTSSMTFEGDYNALSTSNQLEIKRAMIYNYLLSIGMPLISDVILIQGNLRVLFQVDALTMNISRAITSILSSLDSIPDLRVASLMINGRSYLNPGVSPTNPSSGKDDGQNTGLIVGIVVGLIVVLALVGGVVWWWKRSRQQKESNDENFSMPKVHNEEPVNERLTARASSGLRPMVWFKSLFPGDESKTPMSVRKLGFTKPEVHNNMNEFDDLVDKEALSQVMLEMQPTGSN